MNSSSTSKYLIIAGCVILVVGIIWHFFGDKLGWIGRIPGDIRIEKEHTKIYFPITTMILFSILVSLLLRVINRFF